MFATPKEMAKEYMTYLAIRHDRDQYVLDQIEERKAEAVKCIYKICDPSFAEAIALTIACSFMNELPEAIKIVEKLGLTDKHIAALTNDEELMCQLLLEEASERQYYSSYRG